MAYVCSLTACMLHTYMPIICEVDVAVGCGLAHMCTNIRSYGCTEYRQYELYLQCGNHICSVTYRNNINVVYKVCVQCLWSHGSCKNLHVRCIYVDTSHMYTLYDMPYLAIYRKCGSIFFFLENI